MPEHFPYEGSEWRGRPEADDEGAPLSVRSMSPESAAAIVVVLVISLLIVLTLGRTRPATEGSQSQDDTTAVRSVAAGVPEDDEEPLIFESDDDDSEFFELPASSHRPVRLVSLEDEPADPAPSQTTPPAVAGESGEHVVRWGETYESIARDHYGRPELAMKLFGANPGKKPRKLQVGDRLILPPLETLSPPRRERSLPTSEGDHLVAAGESLGHIAHQHYGKASLWPRIYEANRATIPHPDRIRSGMRLRIP